MIRIIVDAMGSDYGPEVAVVGAKKALKEHDDITITIVGREKEIREFLPSRDPGISIVEAFDIIEMDEPPVNAIRSKKFSSMVVAMNLLKDGQGDALVTAGSTGATIAGATMIVRRAENVERAALAPVFPTMNYKGVLIMDAGANVDCKPSMLQQFGIMGSIYMRCLQGAENPRVGLLCNGTEPDKGNALTKSAHKLLSETESINFVGNVEARDVLSGDYDVIVADGFDGNVLVKSIEGTAKFVSGGLKDALKSNFFSMAGAVLAGGALKKFKKRMDYKEYGGAPLLGISHGIIKAHGSSDERAICRAISQAREFVLSNVSGTISEELGKIKTKEEG